MLTQLLLVLLEHDVGESLKVSKLKLSWFDSRLSVYIFPFLLLWNSSSVISCFILDIDKGAAHLHVVSIILMRGVLPLSPPILQVVILGHSDKFTFTTNPQQLSSFFKILLVDFLRPILYQYCRLSVLLLIATDIRVVLRLFVCCPPKKGLCNSRFVISEL